ncbi:hypothetical protein D1007_28285 [Hordeum vulgare]|nr:hypothetical protein D1007_28285 [Hordeum vulgare]
MGEEPEEEAASQKPEEEPPAVVDMWPEQLAILNSIHSKLAAVARRRMEKARAAQTAVDSAQARRRPSPTRKKISSKDVDVENAENNKDESFYDNEDIDDYIDDDGEVEIDIAETKKLDTHCKVMEMTFQSHGDAYMFYNNHAKEDGFGMRKEKVKQGKDSAGIIWFRWYEL